MTQRKIGRVTVLTNPASGHGNAPHAAERAVAQLQQRGVDVVRNRRAPTPSTRAGYSTAPSSAARTRWWSSAATASSRLRCRSLAQGDIPLGIIPAGTGNDHAREFAHSQQTIPRRPPTSSSTAGRETVDLGRIDGARRHRQKWFGTVMAAGFDSLVTDRTNRMRWPHGRMRYNVAMVAELSKLRLLPFRLAFDGGETIVADLTLAAFGNTKSYGGGMLICPDADHSDGLLDVTMVASASRTQLIRLFPTVFKGTHVDLDEVTHRRARARSRVDSPGINAYADGEYVCPLPVEVSAVPGALKILTPRPD